MYGFIRHLYANIRPLSPISITVCYFLGLSFNFYLKLIQARKDPCTIQKITNLTPRKWHPETSHFARDEVLPARWHLSPSTTIQVSDHLCHTGVLPQVSVSKFVWEDIGRHNVLHVRDLMLWPGVCFWVVVLLAPYLAFLLG